MTAVTTRAVAQAARLHTAHVPITVIGRHLGISASAVRYHLREQGLFPPAVPCAERRVNLPLSAINDAAQAYEAGASLRRCAQELGVSYATTRRELIAAGVTLRPHGTRSPTKQIAAPVPAAPTRVESQQ